MDETQYETSKDIILDLLGWGVDPEYLVQSGLSREIIFYVFTELRLRLPRNLDITGLTPFYPPTWEPVQPAVASQTSSIHSDSSSMVMPPPSIPPRHDAPRATHTSLPQKPLVPQGSPTPSPIPIVNPGRPTQLDVLTTLHALEQERKQAVAETNLHEIEQQRKQELIARKAVQASRKTKAAQPAVVSLPGFGSRDEDVLMGNAVPAESVDDFLKSIGPISESNGVRISINTLEEDVAARASRHENPEAMEVDEIPGFGDASPTPVSGPLIQSPPSSTATSVFSEAASTETGGSHYIREDIPPGENVHLLELVRRGTKRPVASDFVDFESGPQRPSHGYSNGGSHPPSLRRKTTGSFASVSGMRRCVIDLSDSEDDGEGDGPRTEGRRHYSPLPTRGSMPQIGNNNWNSSQYQSNGHLGNQSPAELYAKEEEIKKMKELIALREQSRLKKLAVVCEIYGTVSFLVNYTCISCLERHRHRSNL